MDAKTYPNLNPKLKETYDRIMGTQTPTNPHTALSSPTRNTTPQPHAAHDSTSSVPKPHAAVGHLSHLAYNASMAHKKEKTETAPAATSEIKRDSLMLPVILAAAGVIFFVVYAIFWINFFGLK